MMTIMLPEFEGNKTYSNIQLSSMFYQEEAGIPGFTSL